MPYKYFGNNHRPYDLKICAYCEEEAWIQVSRIYCSRKCSEKANKRSGPPIYTISGYKRYHAIVINKRGRAGSCVTGCEAKKYEWANLTGDYADVYDYIEMCIPCHQRFDRHRVGVIIT